ncbi:MAG: indolepyruvate/phenylpyruvate decarboxylase [Simplicispira suum]|jgi:indolepyruvate decarboxylase|uniref:indolepyruvate/phenylpyruvate decarboxylase n=1 Tax=Simplicispira suum TaxID=2109915 RepID=UPI001C6C6ADA|nr:indolepyruvate/phenylpyruvate decarboxylase [Simplicispira suum]MBW7833470.1 indolepyruvate/phenylpyruvate decarboxylase [Simplicispira suum]
MTLGLSLLRALKNHGAQEIFGIPGDFILPLFQQMEESKILPLITLSHEPGLGFAADAAARMHGGIGVAAVTYGAGALNMVNAVASAYAERSPLVVVAGCPGAVESHAGLLLHHQVRHVDSQWRIFQEITCDQVRLSDPATAPADIARVLRSCREFSQPVLIEVPRDMTLAPMAEVPVLDGSPFSQDAVDECAAEWLARIQAARQPVLVLDVEVRRFGIEAQVAELARRLQLPVLTTFMGRGLLAGDELRRGVQLHGTYLGVAGDAQTTALLDESDLPILLGAILSDVNFGVSAERIDFRRTLIAAHREVRVGHHIYQNIPLAALVAALLERVPAAAPYAASTLPPQPAPPTGLVADDTPLCAGDLSRALNDRILAHGPMPIVSDMGDCLFAAMELLPTLLVAPGYYATMGFGVPAGIGVQVATGERSLILVGDGAFQMTGWEIGNCPRLGLDPIVIVLNNQSWEMIRAFQTQSQCAALGDWRFADLANVLGGRGHRVTTRKEFKAALDAAFAERGRFQLIEFMVPPGDSTPTLQRFSAGIHALRARAAVAG